MSERLEAAVKAWDQHWGDRYGDEALEEMGDEVQVALDAADAVMFSDDAVERAAEALYDVRRGDPNARLVTKRWADLDPEMKPFYRKDVRAVIAALEAAK